MEGQSDRGVERPKYTLGETIRQERLGQNIRKYLEPNGLSLVYLSVFMKAPYGDY